MAALYLHQALFPDDTPSPPVSHRPSRAHQSRQLSSISSVTLNTASENSHAPLVPGVDSFTESSAYLDLLTRQPPHPSEGSAITQLSLHGDPITDRERRTVWERAVRKRLRRLKWARRLLRGVIGASGNILTHESPYRPRTRIFSSYQLPGAYTTRRDTFSPLRFTHLMIDR